MIKKKHHIPISEVIRGIWFITLAFIGVIYWAARQDSSLDDIREHKIKIDSLENRIIIIEVSLNKLQVKMDDIKEDLSLIKSAVIK